MGYFGSKGGAGVYQAIIALMPPHDVFIESHYGGGAIMRHKPPAARSIAVDIDAAVIAGFDYTISPGVEAVRADARAFIDGFDFAGSRVLIYSDPPYLLETRTSATRYHHEYTRQDHIDLIASLRGAGERGAAVILSGYPSALYDDLLPDWNTKTFQAMTRGGVRTEKLWFNFAPAAVHWSTYAGANFTDRQRIKRKAARWRSRYQAMSPGEQLAILAAILELE